MIHVDVNIHVHVCTGITEKSYKEILLTPSGFNIRFQIKLLHCSNPLRMRVFLFQKKTRRRYFEGL